MTTKTVLHTGIGTKDVRTMARQAIQAFGSSLGVFLAACRQGAENARDAHATMFRILMDRRKDILRYVDNGDGFGGANVDGFLSYCVSPKATDTSSIGRRGSGRFSYFQFANRLIVYSRSSEFGEAVGRLILTTEDFEYLLDHDRLEKPFEAVQAPDFWDLQGTGTVIDFQEVDWEKVAATQTKVIETFSRQLRPSIADIVRVGTPGGSLKRLKPREIVGQRIHKVWSLEALRELSTPECDFTQLVGGELDAYIPTRRVSHETMEIAAYNPVMTFRDFLRQLDQERPDLAAQVPSAFVDESLRLCGVGYCDALNEFVAPDRRSFNPELFRSPVIEAWVRFIAGPCWSLVQEVLREKQEQEVSVARRKLLEGMTDACNKAFKFDPTKDLQVQEGTVDVTDVREDGDDGDDDDGEDEPTFEIALSAKRAQIYPGDSEEFRVLRTTGTSGRFRWEIVDGGGKLSKTTGKVVTFTAPKDLGRVLIQVTDATDVTKFATISVQVISPQDIRISPHSKPITAGESQRFSVRNKRPGRYAWTVHPETDAVTLNSNVGDSVIVTVDESCDRREFTLCVQNLDEEEERASATFEVIDRPLRLNTVKIQDDVYVLDFVSEDDLMRQAGDVVTVESRAFMLKRGHRAHRMWMNHHHAIYRASQSLPGFGSQEHGMFLSFLPDMIFAHLQRRFSDGDFDDVALEGFDPDVYRDEANEIRRQILESFMDEE